MTFTLRKKEKKCQGTNYLGWGKGPESKWI
jgi:hypothetical protein